MSVIKARKKPVQIEAMQWDGTAEGAIPIINWILANGDRSARYHDVSWVPGPPGTRGMMKKPAVIKIDTLEGTMEATEGDYIIRGVEDEFYPIKSSIFLNTYDIEGS